MCLTKLTKQPSPPECGHTQLPAVQRAGVQSRAGRQSSGHWGCSLKHHCSLLQGWRALQLTWCLCPLWAVAEWGRLLPCSTHACCGQHRTAGPWNAPQHHGVDWYQHRHKRDWRHAGLTRTVPDRPLLLHQSVCASLTPECSAQMMNVFIQLPYVCEHSTSHMYST